MPDPSGLKPSRAHYMLAVLRALDEHGGSAIPATIYAWLSSNAYWLNQSPPINLASKRRFQQEIRFARQELADAGILVSKNSRWALANPQSKVRLTADDARRIVGENRRRRASKATERAGESTLEENSPDRFGPTTGPRPVTWEGNVVREDGPAWTYAFKFEHSDLWKIGFAIDIHDRLKSVNQHVPIEILGRGWTLALSTHWPSQIMAHAMEQEVLSRLVNQRTRFERVRCSPQQLKTAWDGAQVAVKKSS